MKCSTSLSSCLSVILIMLLGGNVSAQQQYTALNQAMQQQIDTDQVAGLVALVAKNHEIIYHEAFGHRILNDADAPMKKDTLFRIYSMTKPIVAVAAMSIWEEGKFKLDSPIGEHLPEWQSPKVRIANETVPAENPITPRQLMTHSSGITYNKQGLKLDQASTLEQASIAIASRPLKFHPGTSYAYGYSLDILGRFLEVIEGKSLDVILKNRIFDKLDMTDTGFWVPKAEDQTRVAMIYSRYGRKLVPAKKTKEIMSKPNVMYGGHGLISTSSDYAKFCAMLANEGALDGVRVLKKETVDLLFKNHLEPIGKKYGLGGSVDQGKYSWGGMAGTKFWVEQGTGNYGVFMIQIFGSKPTSFRVFTKELIKVY